MTTETQQDQQADAAAATDTAVVERTQEQLAQDDKDDNAAFAAGFDGAHDGNSPALKVPAKDAAKTDEGQAADAVTDTTPTADAAVVEEPVIAGLKESEIKALLGQVGELRDYRDKTEKTLQQIFGKFGDIQRQITAGSGAALTKREVNAEALKQLNAEYPEIAGLLAGDLGALLSATPSAGPGITQEQVDSHVNKVVAERVSAATDALNMDMLSRFHEDWQNYVPGGSGKTDIDLWLSTQSADYRSKFLDSHSASFIANGLDKFKAWKQQSTGTRQTNTSRLERSIAPKGGARPGQSTIPDDAQFEAGFKAVRGGASP